jgi:hypothetical protein
VGESVHLSILEIKETLPCPFQAKLTVSPELDKLDETDANAVVFRYYFWTYTKKLAKSRNFYRSN